VALGLQIDYGLQADPFVGQVSLAVLDRSHGSAARLPGPPSVYALFRMSCTTCAKVVSVAHTMPVPRSVILK